MHRIDLEVSARSETGKGVARRLRRQGRLPGVLYRQGTSVAFSIDAKQMTTLLQTSAGEHTLINLTITGDKKDRTCVAIVRDQQRDPVTDALLHVDFFEISMDKPIRLMVPIAVVGEVPAGVKEGGVLQHHLREIEIECLPIAIPDDIKVDPSVLQINDAIHIRDLAVDPAVRLLAPPDHVVVSVAAPMSEAKLEELLTATAKETKEPELVKKERKEEGEEAEAAAKPAGAEKEGKETKEAKKEGKEEKK